MTTDLFNGMKNIGTFYISRLLIDIKNWHLYLEVNLRGNNRNLHGKSAVLTQN